MTLARFLTDEPVSTPTFTLRTDDVDVEPGIEVASIVITRQVNKVATAEVYIYDGDAAKADGGAAKADGDADADKADGDADAAKTDGDARQQGAAAGGHRLQPPRGRFDLQVLAF